MTNATSEPRFPLTREDVSAQEFARTAGALWERAEVGSVRGIDGVKISYRVFSRDPARPAIVVCNGRTESMLKYQELAYDLVSNGYSVYLWDHRGQGYSGKLVTVDDVDEKLPSNYAGHPSGHVEDFDHYVEDMRAFIDAVVSPNAHPHRYLLAHSMGGCISSLFLQRYRGYFDAVALSSPMHEPGTGIAPAAVMGGLAKLAALVDGKKDHVAGEKSYTVEPFEGNDLTHCRSRYDRILAQDRAAPETQVGAASHEWLFEAVAAARTARERAAKIRIPVLLVQAGADTIVTAEGQEEFRANLDSARPGACRLLCVQGGRHELFVESDRYRDQALTAILEFFADA